jgi:F0F1-type ATP synthase assembly protein I
MALEPKSDDSGRGVKPFAGVQRTLREVGPYLTLGIQLAAAVIVFFLIGWWLDTRQGTAPLFMLIGIVVGFVGGMIKFLKSISELTDKRSSGR